MITHKILVFLSVIISYLIFEIILNYIGENTTIMNYCIQLIGAYIIYIFALVGLSSTIYYIFNRVIK
jgi:hypothetical protein